MSVTVSYMAVSFFQNIISQAPVLTCDEGEYQLYINGMPLLLTKASKFTNALEALFQSYWVFALDYPREIKKTLLFLESHIFQHDCKLPASVWKWIRKLGILS